VLVLKLNFSHLYGVVVMTFYRTCD